MAWAVAYALLSTIVALVFASAILLGPYRAVQRSDYMTYHMAARIVLDGHGACLYDQRCQADAQFELIGEEPTFVHGPLPFNDPPWFAALVVPLGLLPLAAGFAIFTVLALAILAWGTWRAATHAGLSGLGPRLLATILVLTAWPTVLAAIRGQSTLLAAGLIGLSVGLARYRSGLALGLSLLKPTVAPLWGAWQLLGGHWRAVGTALLTGVAFLVLAAVVVSPQALIDYPGYLVGVAGDNSVGVHPEEMVNWRGAAQRLDLGLWFVIGGSLVTLSLVALAWMRTQSRHLGAAAAFIATPLVVPHANQHLFVLATIGILLAVIAVPELRRRLATVAILLHLVAWGGVALDGQTGAWLLFGLELGWLVVVVWISGRRTD
jgi:Glycosyltransferase family 87